MGRPRPDPATGPRPAALAVCAWPALQITETRTVLDLSGLAEAAAAVQELWRWEPPDDQPRPSPRGCLPTAGSPGRPYR